MLPTKDLRQFGLVLAVSSAIACLAGMTTQIQVFELFLHDYRISHFDRNQTLSEDIVVIAIDDQTLDSFDFISPINRKFLAEVLQKLDKAGSSAIGLDILLDKSTLETDDSQLESTLNGLQTPIVFAADPGIEARQALCQGNRLNNPTFNILERFASHGTAGHAVLCNDIDDVLRRKTMSSEALPSFTAALLKAGNPTASNNVKASSIRFEAARQKVLISNTEPKPDLAPVQSRWRFNTYSAQYATVLPDSFFKNKIVLIGMISPYSADWRMTPLRFNRVTSDIEPGHLMPEGKLPGVIVHAYALQSMLDGRNGPSQNMAINLVLIALGALAGLGLGVWRVRRIGLALAAIGLVIGWWLFAYYLYGWTGTMLQVAGTIIAMIVSAASMFAIQEQKERERRQFIHASFSHFLAPEVVDELVNNPERLKLEASSQEVTSLFTDLEGFTSLVDTLPPDKVSRTINDYLDVIVDCVVLHGGVVDKIVGDAVHALFSAPVEDPDHRRNALLCALDIKSRTSDHRKSVNASGIALGRTRIGISSGPVLLGNFGSSRRFDYTAHGSTINLAARLEAENKKHGSTICLSKSSRVEDDRFFFRNMGVIPVRGLTDPVEVYELHHSSEMTRKGDD